MNRFMRGLAVIGTALLLAACDRVPNGYVGVQVQLYGEDKGVAENVKSPGRHWSGPNTEMYLFPTFTVSDRYEGEQQISFAAAGGITVKAPIGTAYHIERDKVPVVFQKYRKGADEISDIYLRNMIRDGFNRIGVRYSVEDLQGEGKQRMIDEVLKEVKEEAYRVGGITVEDINYLGDLAYPPQVIASINAKIQATQNAMQVENELRKTQAEGAKRVADAKANEEVAQSEARAQIYRAQAAQNNPMLFKLREIEMQEKWIEKWDGKMPVTQLGSDSNMLFNVDK